MKLHDLHQRIGRNARLDEVRRKLNDDIAFQMSHRIEMLRLSLGLTQEQFAKKIGTQQPAIARIERGVVIPTLPFLQKIAKTFKMELVLPDFVPTASRGAPIKSPLKHIGRARVAA